MVFAPADKKWASKGKIKKKFPGNERSTAIQKKPSTKAMVGREVGSSEKTTSTSTASESHKAQKLRIRPKNLGEGGTPGTGCILPGSQKEVIGGNTEGFALRWDKSSRVQIESAKHEDVREGRSARKIWDANACFWVPT